MTRYVLGFRFSEDREKVILIKKLRPAWQQGLWNGVGGHIEESESSFDAMQREFKEETGKSILDWEYCGVIESLESMVHIFRSFGDFKSIKSNTDETIEAVAINQLDLMDVIPNLRWMVPMLLEKEVQYFNVGYNNLLGG